MAKIDDTIRKQREALANKEAAALFPTMRAYDGARRELNKRIDRLTQRIDALRAEGKPVRIGTIFALEQAQELLRIANQEYGRVAAIFVEALGQTLPDAARQGSADASALIRDQLPEGALGIDFVDINMAAVEAIVGTTQSGPLRDILNSYGPKGAQDLADALTTGVVMGQGALVIGRRMKDAAGISAYRARMIARTETNRVYRAASQETMQRHADVLNGWQWRSAGMRACIACLVMHGTIHPLDEPMTSHPNCRCAPIPVPKSWKDLGFDIEAPYESRLRLKPGPEIFADATPEEQRRLLGPKGYEAFQRGEVTLQDFLHETDSDDWGRTRTQGSVKRAQENNGREFPYTYSTQLPLVRTREDGSMVPSYPRWADRRLPPPGPEYQGTDTDIPVMEWEIVEHRVRLPTSIQRQLGIPAEIARWHGPKRDEVLKRHPRDNAAILALEDLLTQWSRGALLVDGHNNRWNIRIPQEDKVDLLVAIGIFNRGSINIITAFTPKNWNYIDNLEKTLKSVPRKG